MALRLVLDTSAYSHFCRGETAVVEEVDRATWIGVPTVTLGELWTGFLAGRSLKKNTELLHRFLDHPIVEVVPIDEEVARIYGELVAKLKKIGKPLPTNDIWIGASASRCGATVLTYDGHFRDIERVGSIVLEEA